MAAESGKNPVEYIQHHLGNWQVGHGITAVNLDTVLFSLLTGGILVLIGWWIGRRITAGRPGRLQNVLEVIVVFVNQQIRETFPVKDPFIGPMALTIFLWVMAMNAIDLIPVDFFPKLAGWVGGAFGLNPAEIHFRALATSDLMTPFALSISVFCLTIIYGIRYKGTGGYVKHFLTHPYGKFAAPVNLIMTLIEELARPISLALRLWGNMFAGDLLFMLIALFGFTIWISPFQVVLGTAWTIFEGLEVVLQAFIFMLLSVVYLSLAAAREDH